MRLLLIPWLCSVLIAAEEPSPPASSVAVGTVSATAVTDPSSPTRAETDRQRFRAALARAPGIAAAQARAQASVQALGAAGVLPDPMVGADVGQEFPRSGDRMTMYGAMVEQPLPRWGERDAARLMAQAEITSAEADFQAILGEHAAAVAAAAIEAEAAGRSRVLVAEARTRTASLADAVRARLAGGEGQIGEALAIDTRLSRYDLELSDLERRAADAQAEVRGRLGLGPDAELPPACWPDPDAIALERNPSALKAQAAAAEAEAAESEAIARGRPETSLGLIWEREAAGTDEQNDKVSLALKVSLPIWRAAYDDAGQAARQRARAAAHEARGATWMARSLISRAQRAAAQAARAEAVADGIARRADTEYDAIIRQVGTGAASFATALDLLDRVTEARLQAVEAQTVSRLALADLWRLAPPVLDRQESDVRSPESEEHPHDGHPEHSPASPSLPAPESQP